MKWNFEGMCPICSQSFPRAQLHVHILAESPALRHEIMQSIQARHPHWMHHHGICQSCWDFHRQLPQAVEAR